MDTNKNKNLALPQAKPACPHLGHPRICVGGSISKPSTSPILNPNLVHPTILNHIPVFLSKLKYLKINYDKFTGKIIKMSYVKSKNQLTDFLIKAIGSKALQNIFGKFGLGDPKTKLEGECRKVEY